MCNQRTLHQNLLEITETAVRSLFANLVLVRLVWSEPNLVWSGNPKPNLVWQKWTRIGLGLSQKLKVWFCRCIIHRKQHLRSSSNQKWFSERDFVWAQPKVKSSRFCRARNQRNQLDTSFFSACGRNFVICVFYTKPEIFTFFTLNPKFSQNNTNTRGGVPPTIGFQLFFGLVPMDLLMNFGLWLMFFWTCSGDLRLWERSCRGHEPWQNF